MVLQYSSDSFGSLFGGNDGNLLMMAKSPADNTHFIKREAVDLGFDFCGISKAQYLEEEAPKLEKWLQKGMHGKMVYMENHFEKRLDPTKLVPGAKSVVSLLYNYYPANDLFEDSQNTEKKSSLKISKYTYGQDYHLVIKQKLKVLLERVRSYAGDVEGRVFVDSAPVMERAWAQKSGIGWIGKNSLLLNKSRGSFLFLAEMILDLEFEYDTPVKDFCGTCTRCMDACPTDAIPEPYVVDSNRCISYLTIELKDKIPGEYSDKMENWIFGCDICQDVCPWNRFSKGHQEPLFNPSKKLKDLIQDNWEEITHEVFDEVFEKSALRRTRFEGLERNISFIKTGRR